MDWAALHRAKHPWAEKTLGLVGINGFHHKRPDRALDVHVGHLRKKLGRRDLIRTVRGTGHLRARREGGTRHDRREEQARDSHSP